MKFLDKTVDWGGAQDWFDANANENTSMEAFSTYRTVMTGLQRFDKLSDLLRWCIDIGGDTDSAAAISMAIASCSKEFKSDLPQALYDGLENGEFGRVFLERLEAKVLCQGRNRWLASNPAC